VWLASAPGEPIEPGDEGGSLVERLRQVRAR
jgi:ABC-2 type transport system ATP-binding protein